MIDLNTAPHRIYITADLAADDLIQPVGFKDIGNVAPYRMGDHKELLIDTEAAMANWLEAPLMCEPDEVTLVTPLKGLPHVQAIIKENNQERILTTSLLEAHRIASYYLFGYKHKQKDSVGITEFGYKHKQKDSVGITEFGKELQAKLQGKAAYPGYFQELVKAIFQVDPNSLVHGVFFPHLQGVKNRIPRTLSVRVRGINPEAVSLGGVKLERVTASGGDAKKGASQVPYFRKLFAVERVEFRAAIDVHQIRQFGFGEGTQAVGLSEPQKTLILALCLWKIRKFLTLPYRPRTACDLMPNEQLSANWSDFPSLEDLEKQLPKLIKEAYQDVPEDQRVATVLLSSVALEAAKKASTSEAQTQKDEDAENAED